MRAGAANFAILIAYLAAGFNALLVSLDLLSHLWLTASLQAMLVVAAVCAAYLVARSERPDVPPPWMVEHAVAFAAYAVVGVVMFTVGLILHTYVAWLQ